MFRRSPPLFPPVDAARQAPIEMASASASEWMQRVLQIFNTNLYCSTQPKNAMNEEQASKFALHAACREGQSKQAVRRETQEGGKEG